MQHPKSNETEVVAFLLKRPEPLRAFEIAVVVKSTGEQTSLKTHDRQEADRLLQAHNEAESQPALNLGRKSGGLIHLDQGACSSKAATMSRPRPISARKEFSSVSPMRSKAFLACAAFWPSVNPVASKSVLTTAVQPAST